MFEAIHASNQHVQVEPNARRAPPTIALHAHPRTLPRALRNDSRRERVFVGQSDRKTAFDDSGVDSALERLSNSLTLLMNSRSTNATRSNHLKGATLAPIFRVLRTRKLHPEKTRIREFYLELLGSMFSQIALDPFSLSSIWWTR